jgi:carbonic anhydrase/acetyltransferase-like protein (isoleucine patch superfamily)
LEDAEGPSVFEFEGRIPVIAETAYVDEDAKRGDVRIGQQRQIGPGTRIRGDYGNVVVGVPAKVIREVLESDKKVWSVYKDAYADLAIR